MSAPRHVLQGVALGSLLLLAACASTAEVPPETAQGLNDLKSSLANGKAQIERTTSAARDLAKSSPEQMEAQIGKLLTEVDALEMIAMKGRAQYEQKTAAAQVYFAQWDATLKTMSDSVQKAGQQRREEVMKSFDTLTARLQELKGTFRPYMDALTEAAAYLKTDKTSAGVKAIHPRLEEALDAQSDLMKEIDAVNGQIDRMLGA